MSIEAVGVVVPARNESASIAACLHSILDALPCSLRTLVVLVDDGSSDGTAETAASVLRAGKVLRTAGGNVGAARRAGAERALQHFGDLEPDQVWLASTDADSSVPLDWLERQLSHASSGAAAVAGLVRPVGLVRSLETAFEERYRTRIHGDSHSHIHGANMGVRGSAYVAVGGFAPLSCHEDRTLWERLVRGDHRVVTDRDLVVATSGRSHGRLQGGFATDIANLEAGMA